MNLRIHMATLVTEPMRVARADGFEVLTCMVELTDTGEVEAPRINALFPPPAPGVTWWYNVGQVVRVLRMGGSGVCIVWGSVTTTVAAPGRHMILAPPAPTGPGKLPEDDAPSVRAGSRESADWQAAMAYDTLHQELVWLRDAYVQLANAVAPFIAAGLFTYSGTPVQVVPPAAGTATDVLTKAANINNNMIGGKPSQGFEVHTSTPQEEVAP